MPSRPKHWQPAEVVRRRVLAGADLLDADQPGWWRTTAKHPVNLTNLNMHHPQHCPLGQVYGRYRDGVNTLFTTAAYAYARGAGSPIDVAHGFNTDLTDQIGGTHTSKTLGAAIRARNVQLTQAWATLIQARRDTET